MNICIIGAGNIGTYLAAYISLKEENKVWLHTSRPSAFNGTVELIEEEKNLVHNVKLHCVTSSLEEAVGNADYVLITHPSFMVEETIESICPYLKKGTVVGVVPGFGGKEYLIQKLLEKECIFFGTQRVTSIIRLKEYGKSVVLKQKNPFVRIAAIPKEHTKEIAETMEKLIDIPCFTLDSYLGITLSPSNPTMHPSRLYELFKDYVPGETMYERNPYFYEEWGTEASKSLLEMDEELKAIFNSINENNDFNPLDMEKIKVRYEIETPEELSKKINTAPGFIGIDSPMAKVEGGYIPDLSSRYFIEDLQFGLCIIKAFAELCSVETPKVDEIIYWAQKLLKKEYVVNGRLTGKDVSELAIPQNRGIKDKRELIKYYKNI